MIHHRLFGAAHLDRIGTTASRAVPGQSNPGTMREAPGGAALNVASSLAALGAPVTLNCPVGYDAAGARIQSEATARGITVVGLDSAPDQPTATYTAILDATGELLTALSDMEIYTGVTLRQGTVFPTDWLHLDTNFPEPVIGAILSQPAAHRSAMTVSAAKAPRLRAYLPALDILFTNRAEAAALCVQADDLPLAELAASLATDGTRRAVLTDGAAPLCVMDGDAVFEVAVPACPVENVTGAGDALAAAVLYALAQGQPFDTAVDVGIKAAQAILAVNGPYRADLAATLGATP